MSDPGPTDPDLPEASSDTDASFTFTWLVAQLGAGIAFVVFGILDGLFALLG